MQKFMYMQSPIGQLLLAEEQEHLTIVGFADELGSGVCEETPTLLEAKKQIEEYFMGERKTFDLPLMPKGTDFQKKVWKALQEIPYGQTSSYGEIAVKIGSPKGARAVGMANNRNPLPIIVPCHRVIGADGSLVGYAGGLESKRHLLELEKRQQA